MIKIGEGVMGLFNKLKEKLLGKTEENKDSQITKKDNDIQATYDRGLKKTSNSLGEKLNSFLAQFRTIDEDFFDDLEDLLIEADVGYETAEMLTDELRNEDKLKNVKDSKLLKNWRYACCVFICWCKWSR